MNTHKLKTDPEVFEAVRLRIKTCEIRLNDRDFQIGDRLELHETAYTGEEMKAGQPLLYTGRAEVREVSHVLTGYGLMDGWCCLSFADHRAPAQPEPNCCEDAREQIENLDVLNFRLRQGMCLLMGRLADLLDEDQFAECEGLVAKAGVEPTAAQPESAAPRDQDWTADKVRTLLDLPYVSDEKASVIAARLNLAWYAEHEAAPTVVEPARWEGGEGWESLAWELCADENGEDACNELIWEGGTIPEPWGDRWMKYEGEAKRLIALVHKHVATPLRAPTVVEPAGKLHQDGYFTWNRRAGKDYVLDKRLPCDFYLAPLPATPPRAALSDEQIDRHSIKAGECPPDSKVMLVSSIRRLLAGYRRPE